MSTPRADRDPAPSQTGQQAGIDLRTREGHAIAALFNDIVEVTGAGPDACWDGGDIVPLLSVWFTDLGIDVTGPALDLPPLADDQDAPRPTGEYAIAQQIRRARRLAGELTEYGDRLAASPAVIDRITGELCDLATALENLAADPTGYGGAAPARSRPRP